jgi:hypothetical protein
MTEHRIGTHEEWLAARNAGSHSATALKASRGQHTRGGSS